ncbi:MAG: homoserine kinase [Candidatus Paceibacteria bacterium]|jgi:homoserine kinase
MSPPPPASRAPLLTVRVPASTSNLGPGFDQLGLALKLYLEVRLEGPLAASQHELVLAQDEAADWPRKNNRLTTAFDAVLAGTPGSAEHYRFHVRSEIPLCRGLGSSGAATAAGLTLAAELLKRKTGADERPRLDSLGLQLEGHPDNVIASLYGGCTLGVVLPDQSLRVVQQAVHPELVFAVVWPSGALSTEEARAAMPAAIPLEDVVWSTRRLSLLLQGLRSGDGELLRHGVDDRLHTPYRLPLIPGAEQALRAANLGGALFAAISGSGSALIACQRDDESALALCEVMQRELDRHHEWSRARVLRMDATGAQLV